MDGNYWVLGIVTFLFVLSIKKYTNLDLLRENLHLIENISLFTEVNKQIFAKIISKLKSGNKITIKDLEIDNQLIDKIDKFAPIKYILEKKSIDNREVIRFLDDLNRDLNSYKIGRAHV